ncbi:hypothetical protein ACFQ1M_00005 [Sungkyunkwania multivorans]|uniref:Uncharacterized protein n=1 Tax=Sungkyunkwania multivorans TaxID=1173618 RepID=A0ABW3CU82_9FLAO
MKDYRLTIITENQKSLEKANMLGSLICNTLNTRETFEATKYDKFENSYKIEFSGQIKNLENSISESIELTDRIVNSWSVEFKRKENEIALLFTKTEFSNFRKQEFNVIVWANFEMD